MRIKVLPSTERSINNQFFNDFIMLGLMTMTLRSEVLNLPTLVKNKMLVEQRRQQIIEASVNLFIENGFHKTTTRQIAKASGISVGSLYEYINSKEDVLYLVCKSIHEEIEKRVNKAVTRAKKGTNGLNEVIKEYFEVCHQMQDRVLLIYQEIKSLPKKQKRIILHNEERVALLFKKVILELVELKKIPPIGSKQLDIIVHNICVLGHMWVFRRWFLADNYSIRNYLALQTKNIMGMYYASSNPSI